MLQDKLRKLYSNFKYFSRIVKTYTLQKYNIFEILVLWSKRQLTRFQFLVLSGIIVGFLGGVAGICLKTIVHYIQVNLMGNLSEQNRMIAYGTLPIIGILLTTFISRYIYRRREEIKLSSILIDIAQHESNINRKETHSQMVQSAITVGLGGSAGLETPMVITGAAIGSNFAKRYRLGYKEKTLLLAGGAAAGIASAFNAPIAGIMFSFEVLLTGIVFSDFIPLIIASMCGSLLTTVVLNNDILFILGKRELFDYRNVFYFVALGLVSGIYSRYYILIGHKIKKILQKFKYGSFRRALIGGIILSSMCVLFPGVYGEGYINIKMLDQGNIHSLINQHIIDFFSGHEAFIFIMLLLTTLAKAVATSATLNSGGVDGNFAPSLISGGLLGYTFGYGLSLIGFNHVPVTNLMLVGMAGVLSAVMYAPLTAIFLIAEISSGYDLFIPLMIVSVTSFLINKYFSPINPEMIHLAGEGKIFTSQLDRNTITQISLMECVEKDDIIMNNHSTIAEIYTRFKNTDKSVVAVVGEDGYFFGMISRERLNQVMSKTDQSHIITASEISEYPNGFVMKGELMQNVVRKFEESDTWYLPLVDEQHVFIGFISRYLFLKRYRALLKELS
ncbi:MAG: chloride channel protein [Bacteroidia bacterium]|nr:chloride channel protein [Bacteroidia bacterium]MCZ2247867.1 chloride channel protein [Bacteroidia bacterium]